MKQKVIFTEKQQPVKQKSQAISLLKPPDYGDTDEQLQLEKEGRKKGEIEAHTIEAKKKEQTLHNLETIAKRHEIELLRAKTVFPFHFFPSTLIIDTTKVAIVKKQLFATEYITTIPLKDLADTHVQTAFFLASLTLEYLPQASNTGLIRLVTARIDSLKRTDAIRAKNILKGILVARAESIDIGKLSSKELLNVIEKLGSNADVN